MLCPPPGGKKDDGGWSQGTYSIILTGEGGAFSLAEVQGAPSSMLNLPLQLPGSHIVQASLMCAAGYQSLKIQFVIFVHDS